MLRTTILLLILILTAGAALAQAAPKNITAGAGVYVVTLRDDGEDSSFEGYAITGSMALGPGSAIRGHLYFTEHEDESNLKLNGFDAQFLLGSNLNRLGFKIYALGGYWKETLKVESTTKTTANEKDFAGFMAGLGIGYNWSSAALDFWVAWRQPDEWREFSTIGTVEPDFNMGAGALTFGLRF